MGNSLACKTLACGRTRFGRVAFPLLLGARTYDRCRGTTEERKLLRCHHVHSVYDYLSRELQLPGHLPMGGYYREGDTNYSRYPLQWTIYIIQIERIGLIYSSLFNLADACVVQHISKSSLVSNCIPFCPKLG